MLTPHAKRAIRPASNDPATIASAIYMGYRICWYGRPGPAFVDFPGDFIMTPSPTNAPPARTLTIAEPPRPAPDPALVFAAANLLKSAIAPLVIIGKGSAYARAEASISLLINCANIPFLPTPMGKGVVPDSSPLNTSSARSTALNEADVVLLLGARLNWILHFGSPPKFRKDVKIIQVDICSEDLGRTNGVGDPSLSIFADITLTVDALAKELRGWQALPRPSFHNSKPDTYAHRISQAISTNQAKSRRLAMKKTNPGEPLTFQRAFHIIKETIHTISPPSRGEVVYVSEGSQTMDISRPIFPLEYPRQRLDAGTYATMGVGMGYSIAAWAAYNLPQSEVAGGGNAGPERKKITAIEGDSALGFSGMEIETMARLGMDILIICMNNSGIYHGDTADTQEWKELQRQTIDNEQISKKGLRSTSLLHETRYEKLAEMVGGSGYLVKTEAELARAVEEGFRERQKVVLINVIVEPGLGKSISSHWREAKEKSKPSGSKL